MNLNDDNVDLEIKDFLATQTDIIIDRYSDTGSNGELYFGLQNNIFKERVALKFYYCGKTDLFHKEPQILRSIEHPNILKVLDAKRISDLHAYFLTPEINGGDLEKYMESHELDTHFCISIVKDILKGLSEMHKSTNRILHRDIKPNNILISNVDQSAIIADFGSIKHIPSKQTSISASRNSMVYRPKESVLHNEYNFQSDIYQTGIVLFQLLGGHFPKSMAGWLSPKELAKSLKIEGSFDKQVFMERIIDNLIVKGKLLNLESLPPYIDKTLKTLIKRATNPDLNKRFSSAAEFFTALAKYKATSINWLKNSDIILAQKNNGYSYRIIEDNKVFVLEKSINKGSFRRTGSAATQLSDLIEKIRK
jgi:serine/threonine protein kinase